MKGRTELEEKRASYGSLQAMMMADNAIVDGGPEALVGGKPAVVILAMWRHRDLLVELLGTAEGQRHLRLPKLTIRSTQKYISAVARAVELGQLSKGDANSLLYAAQMLLAAHRYHLDTLPPEQTEVQAKRLGFVQAFAADFGDAPKDAATEKTVGKKRSANDLGGEKCLQR